MCVLNVKQSGRKEITGYQDKPPRSEANGTIKSKLKADKEKLREERERLVLWFEPILTLKYSTFEMVQLLRTYGERILQNKLGVAIFVALATVLGALYHVPGSHQVVYDTIRANLWFAIYWIGLGVLSSVGMGSGLHTFLLYLGPHIANVTLAAYECNSLDFPSPPYPDEVICPEEEISNYVPSIWSIMNKVRLESFFWGAGVAIGELPPYFMGRASRLSGFDPDDADDLKELEELKKKRALGVELSLLERGKILMERAVENVGFVGILICASFPNPLFDAIGMMCGHFLMPFWTFFGATLIGKSIIKINLQKFFVIVIFSETLLAKTVNALGMIPLVGQYLQDPFKTFLEEQKKRLHRSSGEPIQESSTIISQIFEYMLALMLLYFIISIVNSLAQSYHKRINKKEVAVASKTEITGKQKTQ